MKTIRILHLMLLSLSLMSPLLAANPPGVLNHQGRIAVNGANYDGTGYFKFALVDGAGTTTYWSNDATSTGGGQPTSAISAPIAKGHYAVLLGDTAVPHMTSAIPAAVFTDHQTVALRLWFSTADGGPFELLSPDRRIAATGYALAAQRAEAVAPGGVTSTMLAEGAITTGKIANGAVTGTALAPGAVTSAAIADGSITSYDLALGATGLVRKPVLLAEVGGGASGIAPMMALSAPWTIQTVDSVGDVGKCCAFAFSPTGHPTIAYLDATNKDIKFARFNGSTWEKSIIDAEGDFRESTSISLAFGHDGQPAVSYYKYGSGPGLKYARYDGSAWSSSTVIWFDNGEYHSLAFGPSGDASIAWYNHNDFNLHYSRCNGSTGTWVHEVVDPGPVNHVATGVGISLAFDPASGQPAISYGVQGDGELKFASFNGSIWDIRVVNNVGDAKWPATSLAYGPAGQPSFSYYKTSFGLNRAVRNGGTWSIETVDSGGDVGNWTSHAFGPDGKPVITYYDKTNGDLKIAQHNGSTWDINVVDAEGDVGMCTSLDITPSGKVGIAYYDVTNGDLKYAEGGSFQWLGQAAGVFVSNGKAYHTSANSDDGKLTILDVSNPAQATTLVELASPHPTFALGGARDVFVTGTTAYLAAASDSALNIMDVSNPASPQLLALLRDGVAGFDRLAGAWSVFVSGNTAYVTATGDNALTIIDVSNPAAPVKRAEIVDEVGGFTKLAGARDVYVVGTTAYVTAADDNALTILDVSNPASPVKLAEIVDETGGFTKLGGAREVFILGSYAYVTAGTDDALTIIDVSHPTSPVKRAEVVDGSGGFTKLKGASGVFVSGSIALVTAEDDNALTLIDVSDPANPKGIEETIDDVGDFTKLNGASGVFISGTIGFVVASRDDALTIIDLASPNAEYAGTVTNSALATDSVTTDKILDGSVGNPDLSDDSVDSDKVKDGSITGLDLSADVVDSNKIVDHSVLAPDLGKDAVTNDSIADNSVTSSKILDETIVGADLHPDAVTSDKIADGSVGAADLGDSVINSDKIADASIANADLADGSVDSRKITDGSIGTADFADNAVTTSALADNSVTTSKIVDGTIITVDLADGAVTGDKITAGAIGATHLGSGIINSDKIADGSIAAADLGTGIVTTGNLADASVTMGKLNLGGGTGQMLYHTEAGIEWKNPADVLGDESSTNELQQLTRDGNMLTLSIGGGSVSIGDLDADPTNELQTLSLVGDSLSLTPGAAPAVNLGQYFRRDGSQAFGGMLDLNGFGINKVVSLMPPLLNETPPILGTLGINGNLSLGGNNLTNVQSITSSAGGSVPLLINGGLNLNASDISNVHSIYPAPDPTPPVGTGTLFVGGNMNMGGHNITNVQSLASPTATGLDIDNGLLVHGPLDLVGNDISNAASISPPGVGPAWGTLMIGGHLSMGGHNITEVQSLAPAGATDPLKIDGDLDLNRNQMRNAMKIGIGVGEAQGALHVSTYETSGPPISLLEHSVSGAASGLRSIARLRAVTSDSINNGFGAGLAFETKGTIAGPFTIAQVGAVRDGPVEYGALHFQTVSSLPDGLTTKMIVRAGGDVEMQRNLYVGMADGTGDDTIYFDSAGAEYLRWQETQNRFLFSNDVAGTTFSPTSDRDKKEQFAEIDPLKVLDQVAAMPITTWKFKDDDPSLRHIGPMAQDFHQAFGLGLDDRHISTTDADGVALAAIQALKRMLDEKERKIKDLEERLQKLESSN